MPDSIRAYPRFRDERLKREILHRLRDAGMVMDIWCVRYTAVTPHIFLRYRISAPERGVKVDLKGRD
ncbi:hypothetical protein BWR18_01800 [Tateyamaria omphalii]|uniref:Transposase n=1 Tax=Tateyamaria omphalii TaxID=299262 RepID=A0A1P8MR73_9RHOB|nr:hypothetical protein BWR18_01800 [Tateyamaria omphalii]